MIFKYGGLAWWVAAFVGAVLTFAGMWDIAALIWMWGPLAYLSFFGIHALLSFLSFIDADSSAFTSMFFMGPCQEVTMFLVAWMFSFGDFWFAIEQGLANAGNEEEEAVEEEVAAEDETTEF